MRDFAQELEDCIQESKDLLVKINQMVNLMDLWGKKFKTTPTRVALPNEPVACSLKEQKDYRDHVKSLFVLAGKTLELTRKEILQIVFDKAVLLIPEGKKIIVVSRPVENGSNVEELLKKYPKLRENKAIAYTLYHNSEAFFVGFRPDKLNEEITIEDLSKRINGNPEEMQVYYF